MSNSCHKRKVVSILAIQMLLPVVLEKKIFLFRLSAPSLVVEFVFQGNIV